jgi:hypothetical protein
MPFASSKFTGWEEEVSFRILVSLNASFDPVPDYFDPTVGKLRRGPQLTRN